MKKEKRSPYITFFLVLLYLLLLPCSSAQAVIPKAQAMKIDGWTEKYLGGVPGILYYDRWSKELFVLKNNKTLGIYDEEGMALFDITLKENPIAIFVKKSGDIYLTIKSRGIVVFNYRGEYKRVMDLSSVPDYQKISIQSVHIDAEENIYLGDGELARVVVLGPDEKFLYTFGGKGVDKGNFMNIASISTDNTHIYTLDPAMFRVSVFKKGGEFVRMFGQISGLLGGFSMPSHLTVDGKWIYVVDANRAMIVVFDLEGKPVLEFGGLGRGSENLMWPNDVQVDGNGKVFVSDTGNRELKIFRVVEPVDSDGDGVVDLLDSCPAVPGLKKFKGCEPPAKSKKDKKNKESKEGK